MFNKDFGKNVSDFFGKGFGTSHKVSFSIPSNSQFRASAETEIRDDAVATSFTPVWSDGKTDVKFDLKNNGAVSTAVTLRPAIGVSSTTTLGLGAKKTLNVAIDYIARRATFSANLRFPSLQPVCPSVELGAVVKHNNYYGGIIGSVRPDSKQLEYVTLNVQLRENATAARYVVNAAATYFGPNKNQGLLGLFYQYNLRTSIFSQILVNNGNNLVAGLGLSRKLDNSTEAKVALHSTGILGVSASKDINDRVNLTIGSQIDVNTFTHRTGATVSIV